MDNNPMIYMYEKVAKKYLTLVRPLLFTEGNVEGMGKTISTTVA